MANAILIRGSVVTEEPSRIAVWETLRVFFGRRQDTGRWIAEYVDSMETALIRIGIANM